ncbi:DNA-binding transcriptional ArsR family regulator [Cellulosimicrobium cellulans J34]|nr:DNA-binding transcriptional ArsR family regulator [Cellulosimicrobium cellulans J34]SMF01825.1 DNA-binding transcriptional regulator, ArsR family [Cellulosimicrobium cellulans J1]
MSPVHEVVSLARVLTQPGRHAGFGPWLRRRRERWAGLDLSALTVFMADGAYRPDFLDPPPASDEPSFEDGLAAVLAAPVEQVRAELVDATRRCSPAVRARLLGDPEGARSAAADAVRRLWEAAVEPEWVSMRRALRAELVDRALQVGREGLGAVLPRLHGSLTFAEGTAVVRSAVDVEVAGRGGLVLVPSLFITDRVQCATSDHWSPAVFYPASGRYLWSPPPAPRSLDRLVGASRARILASLATPLQTTAVAGLLGVAASTASEHLAVLRDAGLVDSTRAGRTVTHELTDAGRALLAAAGGAGAA